MLVFTQLAFYFHLIEIDIDSPNVSAISGTSPRLLGNRRAPFKTTNLNLTGDLIEVYRGCTKYPIAQDEPTCEVSFYCLTLYLLLTHQAIFLHNLGSHHLGKQYRRSYLPACMPLQLRQLQRRN